MEDLDDFFDTDEFAVNAIWAGKTVQGVMDREFLEEFNVATIRPVFMCRADSVAGATHGDAITVEGITYHIVGIQPEGTGLTQLILEQQE